MSLRSPSTICSRALSWFLLKETVGKGARSVELTVGPQLPSASGEGPASAGPNSRPFASGPYDFRSLWCCSLLLFRPSDRDPSLGDASIGRLWGPGAATSGSVSVHAGVSGVASLLSTSRPHPPTPLRWPSRPSRSPLSSSPLIPATTSAGALGSSVES